VFLGVRLQALGGLPEPTLAERVARIAVELAAETGLDPVRRRAVRGARQISGMSTAAIAHLADDLWRITHADGPLAGVITAWDPTVLDLLSDWVQAKTSSWFPPGEAVPAGHEFLTHQIEALSVQPLIVAGQVAGLLITADGQPAAHDPGRTIAMELLATQTAAMLAMNRSMDELSQQALRDPLTGLHNRRGLFEHLQTAARRKNCALLLLDLDGFKAVNDQLGHDRGDAVLREVAGRLIGASRQGDLVFRLGGDEFAVLAQGVTSPADATALGARFVAAATLADDGPRPPVGASAGIRLLTHDADGTALADADVALYAAKHAGGGNAVLWDPTLRQQSPPSPPP
jgi:diguanylate cyclase (GGDEF)-like protein